MVPLDLPLPFELEGIGAVLGREATRQDGFAADQLALGRGVERLLRHRRPGVQVSMRLELSPEARTEISSGKLPVISRRRDLGPSLSAAGRGA